MLQSKPLVSLSSCHYHQKLFITTLGSTLSFSRKRQRGIRDKDHLSCFSELNKTITVGLQRSAWHSQHSCKYLSTEMNNKNDCTELRAKMRRLCKFFQLQFRSYSETIPSASRKGRRSQAGGPELPGHHIHGMGLRFFHD